MFKISLFIKSFIVLYILFIYSGVFAASWTWVTINELKQSISLLQEKQKEINIKNPDLSSISDIKGFLKDDLNESQISEINKIITEYNTFKTNNINEENYYSQLLTIKKETYKKLTVFVKSEKLNDYLEYIKNNLEKIKQANDLKTEIIRKQEILENKVDAIKIKIQENKDVFENNITDIINTKIDEKLNIIKSNKDFQKLDLEKRKYVIEQIIKKIELKKEEKIKSWNQIKERELYIYDHVIEKLKKFLSELK